MSAVYVALVQHGMPEGMPDEEQARWLQGRFADLRRQIDNLTPIPSEAQAVEELRRDITLKVGHIRTLTAIAKENEADAKRFRLIRDTKAKVIGPKMNGEHPWHLSSGGSWPPLVGPTFEVACDRAIAAVAEAEPERS